MTKRSAEAVGAVEAVAGPAPAKARTTSAAPVRAPKRASPREACLELLLLAMEERQASEMLVRQYRAAQDWGRALDEITKLLACTSRVSELKSYLDTQFPLSAEGGAA